MPPPDKDRAITLAPPFGSDGSGEPDCATEAGVDDWLSGCARFDRRFHVPVALNSFSDEARFLSRLCRRFRVDNQNWALQIRISAFNPVLTFDELCCVSLAAEFAGRLAIELLASGPEATTQAAVWHCCVRFPRQSRIIW